MSDKMDDGARMIAGITILKQYGSVSVCAEHDVIYFRVDNQKDIITNADEHASRLDEYGFTYSDEDECFLYYC